MPQNSRQVLTEVAFHFRILSDFLDVLAFVQGFLMVRLPIRQWTIEAWPVKNFPKTQTVKCAT